MTAHRALFADGAIDGDAVLVHGGAGAVGHAAIQLAVRRGARVATTVSSPEKARLASEAGAELVVNYREEDVVEAVRAWAPDGVDRIVEVAISANLATDGAVLAPYGTIATYGAPATARCRPRATSSRRTRASTSCSSTRCPTRPSATPSRRSPRPSRRAGCGRCRARRFPLEETQAAHEAVEGGFVGKVLIDVPQPPA